MLEKLGLAHSLREVIAAKPKAAAPKRRRIDKDEAPGEERVLRKSLRGKGQEPELPPLLEPLFRRPGTARPDGESAPIARPLRPRAPGDEGGDAAKHDSHNLHRLRTMSDEVMLKRIGKITNTLKLLSLVQVAREIGRDEVADAAQAALDERLACV